MYANFYTTMLHGIPRQKPNLLNNKSYFVNARNKSSCTQKVNQVARKSRYSLVNTFL